MAAKKTTEAPAVIDLDALRAARANGSKSKAILFGGHEYKVPAKLPVYVSILLAENKILDGFKLLLGDEAFDAIIVRGGFDIDDLNDFFSAVYGVDLGE